MAKETKTTRTQVDDWIKEHMHSGVSIKVRSPKFLSAGKDGPWIYLHFCELRCEHFTLVVQGKAELDKLIGALVKVRDTIPELPPADRWW